MKKIAQALTAKPHVTQLYVGLIGSVSIAALLALRHAITGDILYGFLAWNIALAWIAWGLGALLVYMQGRTQRSRIAIWFVAIGWVLFLPNTFYLLTDFIHPIFAYARVDGRVASYFTNSPTAHIVMVDIAIMALATWVGWFLGIVSMRSVYERVAARVGKSTAALTIILVSAAASYAVYLGRIPRWNSWDVYQPQTLVQGVFDPLLDSFSHTDAVVMSFAFFIMISVVFWSFELLSPSAARRNSKKK